MVTPSKPKPPAFLQDDALDALLGERYRNQVLDLLILKDTSTIDPTIGDASCEQRVGFVLDTLKVVTSFLEKNNAWERAQQLVAAHEAAHIKDKADTQVKTVADAKGVEHGKDYDDMIEALVDSLGTKRVRYLTLCHAFSVSSIWSIDEFDIGFSFRKKISFATSTPEAEEEKSQKFLRNREMELREELASLSMEYFEHKTAAVPRNNPGPVDSSST